MKYLLNEMYILLQKSIKNEKKYCLNSSRDLNPVQGEHLFSNVNCIAYFRVFHKMFT